MRRFSNTFLLLFLFPTVNVEIGHFPLKSIKVVVISVPLTQRDEYISNNTKNEFIFSGDVYDNKPFKITILTC